MIRLALILNGLVFTLIGIQTLLDPVGMLARFEIVLPNPAALAHARSIQGGGMASAGVLMWLGLGRADFRRPALITAVFIMGGFGTGRLLGVFLDGATETAVFVGVGVEFALAGLAVAALRSADSASAPTPSA